MTSIVSVDEPVLKAPDLDTDLEEATAKRSTLDTAEPDQAVEEEPVAGSAEVQLHAFPDFEPVNPSGPVGGGLTNTAPVEEEQAPVDVTASSPQGADDGPKVPGETPTGPSSTLATVAAWAGVLGAVAFLANAFGVIDL